MRPQRHSNNNSYCGASNSSMRPSIIRACADELIVLYNLRSLSFLLEYNLNTSPNIT